MVKKTDKAEEKNVLITSRWNTGFSTDKLGRKITCKSNDTTKVTESEYTQLKHKYGIIRLDGSR